MTASWKRYAGAGSERSKQTPNAERPSKTPIDPLSRRMIVRYALGMGQVFVKEDLKHKGVRREVIALRISRKI